MRRQTPQGVEENVSLGKTYIMIEQQEIKEFLEGNDPEEFIVAVEFDYASDSIYKIKEIPGKGKEIRKDTLVLMNESYLYKYKILDLPKEFLVYKPDW